MEAELNGTVFQLLLAEWSGFGDDPGRVFPDLQNADIDHLVDCLEETIQRARLIRQII